MQEAILKIQAIGVPPEGFEDAGFPSEETLALWEGYQDAADYMGGSGNSGSVLPHRPYVRN